MADLEGGYGGRNPSPVGIQRRRARSAPAVCSLCRINGHNICMPCSPYMSFYPNVLKGDLIIPYEGYTVNNQTLSPPFQRLCTQIYKPTKWRCWPKMRMYQAYRIYNGYTSSRPAPQYNVHNLVKMWNISVEVGTLTVTMR